MAALTVCDEMLDAGQRIRELEEELEALRNVRLAAVDRATHDADRGGQRAELPPPTGSKKPRRC